MDLLAKILRVRGLSMREVERLAGLGENSIARLLQGKKNANLAQVFRVLAALDIAAGDFFELSYPRNVMRPPLELLDPRLAELARGKTQEQKSEELMRMQANLNAYAEAAGIPLSHPEVPPAPPSPVPAAKPARARAAKKAPRGKPRSKGTPR